MFLSLESTEGITPTVGFLNSSFSLYRFHVTLFDLGGGSRIRSIWKNYYAEACLEPFCCILNFMWHGLVNTSFGLLFFNGSASDNKVEFCCMKKHLPREIPGSNASLMLHIRAVNIHCFFSLCLLIKRNFQVQGSTNRFDVTVTSYGL